jgi:ribosomal protein S18 acetylase RimI-like enzyme
MRFDVFLRDALPTDAPACAKILQDWLDEMPWMPKLHDLPETEGWMRDHLFATAEVMVAEADRGLRGFLALEGANIASLTVADCWRNLGIGTRLLDRAKTSRPEGLTLWTFDANRAAQRFYARHGFTEIARTDGANDEELPDVRLGWAGSAEIGG